MPISALLATPRPGWLRSAPCSPSSPPSPASPTPTRTPSRLRRRRPLRSGRCSSARSSPSARPDLVRLLAWSTIAQAGWVVLPLAALTTVGHRASVAYALTYAAAGLVAFVVATAVRTPRRGAGIGARPAAY
ncbi:MAG: hypothetical protein IPM00_15760 [Tetrasphaera sp.]|nr:hypothetical protein [Tetrasphaera sp.]